MSDAHDTYMVIQRQFAEARAMWLTWHPHLPEPRYLVATPLVRDRFHDAYRAQVVRPKPHQHRRSSDDTSL